MQNNTGQYGQSVIQVQNSLQDLSNNCNNFQFNPESESVQFKQDLVKTSSKPGHLWPVGENYPIGHLSKLFPKKDGYVLPLWSDSGTTIWTHRDGQGRLAGSGGPNEGNPSGLDVSEDDQYIFYHFHPSIYPTIWYLDNTSRMRRLSLSNIGEVQIWLRLMLGILYGSSICQGCRQSPNYLVKVSERTQSSLRLPQGNVQAFNCLFKNSPRPKYVVRHFCESHPDLGNDGDFRKLLKQVHHSKTNEKEKKKSKKSSKNAKRNEPPPAFPTKPMPSHHQQWLESSSKPSPSFSQHGTLSTVSPISTGSLQSYEALGSSPSLASNDPRFISANVDSPLTSSSPSRFQRNTYLNDTALPPRTDVENFPRENYPTPNSDQFPANAAWLEDLQDLLRHISTNLF